MNKITPCLWFDNNAEEAAKFYVSIFPNSKMGKISYYSKEGAEVSGQKEGGVMAVTYTLNGNEFMAINGGPVFKLSEATSFMIPCKDQKEIDYYWTHLTKDGGQEQPCGWVKDKFGLSWQVVPESMEKMMASKHSADMQRALYKMKKIDLKKLEEAAKGA